MTRHALSWMDDHIPETMLQRMLQAMGPDTFRGSRLTALGLPAPTGEESADRHVMQDRLSDLLDGHDEEASAAALAFLSDKPHRIETVGLEMLRATGLDAAVTILIAHGLSRGPDGGWANVRIPAFTLTAGPARGHEAQVSIEQEGRVMARAPIAPQTYWQDDGVLVIERPLPDAVCIAMEGRALRDIVSHPVLDEHPLSVRRVFVPIGSRHVHVETDLVRRPVEMSGLTLENTRPDRRALAVSRPPRRRMDTTPSF